LGANRQILKLEAEISSGLQKNSLDFFTN